MFATKLKQLREATGYKSQQAFADAFGVAQSTVGNWEAGKREPNQETTIRLAQFFCVSVDSLLDYEKDISSGIDTANIKDSLKFFRELKNLTQEDLASAIGIPEDIISMYERGECVPDYGTLCHLAHCFGVQPHELFNMQPILDSSAMSFRKASLTKEELQLVYAYRQATSDDKKIIDIIVDKYPALEPPYEQHQSLDSDNAAEIVNRLWREREAISPPRLRQPKN